MWRYLKHNHCIYCSWLRFYKNIGIPKKNAVYSSSFRLQLPSLLKWKAKVFWSLKLKQYILIADCLFSMQRKYWRNTCLFCISPSYFHCYLEDYQHCTKDHNLIQPCFVALAVLSLFKTTCKWWVGKIEADVVCMILKKDTEAEVFLVQRGTMAKCGRSVGHQLQTFCADWHAPSLRYIQCQQQGFLKGVGEILGTIFPCLPPSPLILSALPDKCQSFGQGELTEGAAGTDGPNA